MPPWVDSLTSTVHVMRESFGRWLSSGDQQHKHVLLEFSKLATGMLPKATALKVGRSLVHGTLVAEIGWQRPYK